MKALSYFRRSVVVFPLAALAALAMFVINEISYRDATASFNALGERGSAELIRAGAEELRVTGRFDLTNEQKTEVEAILQATLEDDLIVTRRLARSGKSSAAAQAPVVEEPAAEQRGAEKAHSGGVSVSESEGNGVPRVRRIRAVSNGDITRITIDLEDTVQYSSARIANPDRIFF